MKGKKKRMPARSSAMTQEQKEQLVNGMIGDAIQALMQARVLLDEGGWQDNTELLTAMTVTRVAAVHAISARAWIWEFAQERGATKADLLLVQSAPALKKLAPVPPGKPQRSKPS